MQHSEDYQIFGPQSTEITLKEYWSANRTRYMDEVYAELHDHPLPSAPDTSDAPITTVAVDQPAAPLALRGGSPSIPEEWQPGRYVYLPKIASAPGLVIKHINGRIHMLPSKPEKWHSEDRRAFLKVSGLSGKGKPELKTSVKILEKDVRVRVRTANRKSRGKWIGGTRGKIKEFSRGSCSAMRETARNVNGLKAMFTLTYPGEFPCDGRKVKRDLFCIRKWLERRNIGAFWFLEFQRRGAPHYHLFATGIVDKEELSEAWYKIVGSGDEKHLLAGTKVEHIRKPHAIAAYAAKYAAKAEQKEVPEGYSEVGRFWGVFGGVKVVPVDYVEGNEIEVAPLVRVIRKLETSNRKKMGLPGKNYKGRVGFSSYGTSPAIQKYLHWQRYRDVPF